MTHLGSTQKYWYDPNGNQITRIVGTDTFNLIHDAENRLVEVKKNGVSMATFVYDGDGRRVKSTVNSMTTYFVGAHYEVTGSTVTKYYFAGTQRVAMRSGSTLSYLLSDHLGSTSITTDANGVLVSELRYKPWGETRYTSGTTPTKYQFTGQFSYASDFGLLFYNARWYDPAIGRFTSADSIVPGGVQGLDRYAYTLNNPIRFTDPSGHRVACETGDICRHGHVQLRLLTFSTEGTRKWTDEEKKVLHRGAFDVATAIARDLNEENYLAWKSGEIDSYDSVSAKEAFHKVYGGTVDVVRKAGKCADVIGSIFPGCQGWGFSNTKNEIWIFDNATPSIIKAYPRLIVHELGHSFDKITGMSSDMPGNTKNRDGFFGPVSSWQLSSDTTYTEIFADMFVGWVYGKWERNAQGHLTLAATAKSDFMSLTVSYIDIELGR